MGNANLLNLPNDAFIISPDNPNQSEQTPLQNSEQYEISREKWDSSIVFNERKKEKVLKSFLFFVGQRKKQIQQPERRRRDQYWGRNLTRVSNDQRFRFDHLHVAESQLILKVKRSKGQKFYDSADTSSFWIWPEDGQTYLLVVFVKEFRFEHLNSDVDFNWITWIIWLWIRLAWSSWEQVIDIIEHYDHDSYYYFIRASAKRILKCEYLGKK